MTDKPSIESLLHDASELFMLAGSGERAGILRYRITGAFSELAALRESDAALRAENEALRAELKDIRKKESQDAAGWEWRQNRDQG